MTVYCTYCKKRITQPDGGWINICDECIEKRWPKESDKKEIQNQKAQK